MPSQCLTPCRDKEPFDWYQRYGGIKDIITQYMSYTSTILNIGCGNSKLAEEMYEDGYTSITSVDISDIVIEQMQEYYREKVPALKFLHSDIRNMKDHFADGSFDVVLDKGTLDSVLCGDSSKPNSEKALREIHRVLKAGGVYVCVTYGLPDQRVEVFKRFGWTPIVHKVTKTTISTVDVVASEDKNDRNFHYIYVMKKQE